VIRSMTGFAAVGRDAGAERVQVTAKSVNHRFLDVAIKAPSSLGAIDGRVRNLVQQRLARGRVEIAVFADVTRHIERDVIVDDGLIERVVAALESAKERGIIAGSLTASDVLRIPHAVEIQDRPDAGGASTTSEALTTLVEAVVGEAIDALVVMRETEGRFIGHDLETRLATLQTFVDRLETESREGQRHLEARLRERLDTLPPDLVGDTSAITREVVRFVARSDIDEEIVRMRSHVDHWKALVASSEPCGRKLDFLVQEMNREINTIGSKVESAKATELVIAAKAELERVREQVQNVE